MKKILLSFTLLASVLLSKAQLVDLDFSQPAAPGWVFDVTSLTPVHPYEATSTTSNQGLLVVPNGTTAKFLSPELSSDLSLRTITLDFDLFAFSGGYAFANQVPCNANVTLYVVPAGFEDDDDTNIQIPTGNNILGTGTKVFGANTAITPLIANLTQALPANTPFRIIINVNVANCAPNTNYVIDNLVIDGLAETVTPVSFKAFTASRNKSNVGITWTTASEQNNSGFYVQRNDGDGWKNVAFVFSQATGGNSSSDLTYSYNDPNKIKGVSQYRILQVDIDGKSKFSDIRLVKGEEQLGKLIIYPNPSSTGNINIVFDGQASRDINVTDFSGRLIKKYSNVVNNLEIKGLTSGVYSILVAEKATGVKFVQKVVVK